MLRSLAGLSTLIVLTAGVWAHSDNTGYSGAPGSLGTCSISCHGGAGGTIEVSGFPTEYFPGITYTVIVTHNGGNQIVNFNGSCRIGAGSDNAGVISAGDKTSSYLEFGETNGVHFTTPYQDVGDFKWIAPAAGTGDVTLYIAGLQTDYFGEHSAVVLTATESTESCCMIIADINHDGAGPDIADLVYLVNFMFNGGPAPACFFDGQYVEADINGDGAGPDIADLVYLVNFMFNGGPPPPTCP